MRIIQRSLPVLVLFVGLLSAVAFRTQIGIGLSSSGFSIQLGTYKNTGVEKNDEFPVEQNSANPDWPEMLGPEGNASAVDRQFAPVDQDSDIVHRWSYPCGLGYSAPVIANEKLILFYRIGNEEIVDCIDSGNGRLLWRQSHASDYHCKFEYSDGPYSTPCVGEQQVFIIGAQGKFRCLSMRNGEVEWERNLRDEFEVPEGDFPFCSSPKIVDDKVIVLVGGKAPQSGIVAFDRAKGSIVWKATKEAASYSTPVVTKVSDMTLLFVLGYNNLIALDAADGEVLWQEEFHAKNRSLGKLNATSPLFINNNVIVSAYSVGSLCIETESNNQKQVRWRCGPRDISNQYTALVPSRLGVFGFNSRKRSTVCFDPNSGTVRWEWSTDIGREPHLIVINDCLFAFGETGRLAAFDLQGELPVEKWCSKTPIIESPCFTTPIYYKKNLYIRNEKELVCIKVSKT